MDFYSLWSTYTLQDLEPRVEIQKFAENLHLILTDYKFSRPDIFHSNLCVTPEAFDALLSAISDHDVFHNNSTSEQAPVEIQAAVTLYQFGHFGNATGLFKVGLWAGIGWGTVDLFTRCVMMAVCSDRFRKSAICWPNEEEKAAAKAWFGGYVMVDGTCAILHAHPAFYGNSFFGRKQKHSLNVQVCVSD
jgi:hypothetical protein